MMEPLNDLASFIRLRVCLIISSIAAIGFLLFNSFGTTLLLILAASFFGTAGAYAFNNLKDKREDIINRKSLNRFVARKSGVFVIISCFAVAGAFSFFLPPQSLLFSVLGILSSFVYSHFKIKRYSAMKNFFTAMGVGTSFLVGATYVNDSVMLSYIFFFLFIVILSLISDLRDYKGDSKSGIHTLPVSIGYERVRKMILLLLGAITIPVALSFELVFLLPFVFLMTCFLYKDNPKAAHSFGGYSLMFLATILFVL